MRRFSRWMPRIPDPPPSGAAGVLAYLGVFALLAVMIAVPVMLLVIVPWVAAPLLVAVIALSVQSERRRRRQLRTLLAERAGEDIGTFARAFDRRSPEFDSWVIRAVWDELQPLVMPDDVPLPLHPEDRLENDLHLDLEEVEDAALTAARRAGREDRNWRRNSLNKPLVTVEDLVTCVAHQPPRANA